MITAVRLLLEIVPVKYFGNSFFKRKREPVGSSSYDPIEAEEVRKIANFLDTYLNRKIVREHYFFGRLIEPCTFDSSELKAEICRAHEKLTTI